MARNAKPGDYLKCPFCSYAGIVLNPGETLCPKCAAEFAIDDRLESIFVNTNNPRLPLKGNICTNCGLLQSETVTECLNCGAQMYPGKQ